MREKESHDRKKKEGHEEVRVENKKYRDREREIQTHEGNERHKE